MTPEGQQKDTAFIVACGRNLFLGLGSPARAGSVERARRFQSRGEAEEAAEQLRHRGSMFQMPWEVRAIYVGEVKC